MRFEKIPSFLTFLIFVPNGSVATFLATGVMMNLFGTYVISNIFGSGLRSFFSPTYTITSPMSESSSSGSRPSMVEAVTAVAEVLKSLGVGERVNRYMTELFNDEEDEEEGCKEEDSKNCKAKGDQKKKTKRKRRRDSDESYEETDFGHDVHLKDSEEYSQYIIGGKDEAVEELADEQLAEEDPLNFYYIMKNQHKKGKNKRHWKKIQKVPPIEPSGPPPPSPPPPPKFPSQRTGAFRFTLPIFFRFKKNDAAGQKDLPYNWMLKT